MPQVPYKPVPDVSPEMIPTPAVHTQALSETFGVGVGKALEGLGQVGEHAGNELFSRAIAMQELNNETEAKEADARYMVESGKLFVQLESQQGKNAKDAFTKYQGDLDSLRQGIRDGLSNDRARRMYDASSLGTMGRSIFSGARHVAAETRKWQIGVSEGRINAIEDKAFLHPEDENGFKQGLADIEAEIRSQQHLFGIDDQQTDNRVNARISSMWSHRITGLAKDHPFEADKMLRENKDKILEADKQRVENTLRGGMHSTGATMIANKINGDLHQPKKEGEPERTLGERLEEGRKLAGEMMPGDVLLPKYVNQAITSEYNEHHKVIKDQDDKNETTVKSGIIGYASPDGRKPTTIEGLKQISPEMSAAWDGLNDKQKLQMFGLLTKNVSKDYVETPATRARYRTILGAASNDPIEFQKIDVLNEPIPAFQRDQLWKMQLEKAKNAAADPKVAYAMQVLRPIIPSSWDKDTRNHFFGGLQDAMVDWQKTHGTSPKIEDIRHIGKILLRDIPGTGWFGSNVGATQLFELDVPNEVSEEMKKLNPQMDDEEIKRQYILQRYKDDFQRLYGKKEPK